MEQNKIHRTYMRRFVIAMSIYVILLVGVSTLVGYLLATQWNILLAILPAVPLVYAMWAYSHYLAGIDEFQRLIHTRATALAAGVVGIATFTLWPAAILCRFPGHQSGLDFPIVDRHLGDGSELLRAGIR